MWQRHSEVSHLTVGGQAVSLGCFFARNPQPAQEIIT